MSKNYVKAVLDYLPSVTSPIDTLVLLAIAEHTNDENRQAWPSLRALMRRTRLDRRTVQRTLRRLEARSLISTTSGGQFDSVNTASVYRLEFDHRGQPLAWKDPPKRSPAQRVTALRPSTPQSQNVTPRVEPAKAVSHAEAGAALDAIYSKLGRQRRTTP